MDQDPRSYDPYLYQITHRGNPGDRAMYVKACQDQRDILELGCGAGRLLLPLAEAGHDVVGIDQHPGMLASLRGHAAKDPALMDKITLHQQDITQFQLPQTFDRILLPYNLLFCLLTDDAILSCLRSVAAHLKPDGCCIFDVYQVDDDILDSYIPRDDQPHISIGLSGPEFEGYQLIDIVDDTGDEDDSPYEVDDDEEWEQYAIMHEDEHQLEIAERRRWDPQTRRFDADYRYRTFTWGPEGYNLQEEQIFTIPQTYLHHDALRKLCEEAGLIWDQTQGDFRGGQWDEESEHLIVWARTNS